MNENRNTPHFNQGTRPRDCERAEEFVAYLYGEATPEETGAFRQHLTNCNVCREELAAFGGVRAAVGEWRAEALGSLPSINLNEVLAPADHNAVLAPATELRRPPTRKRSARAALGEFFTLSPLWLRAGTLAATLVVCALTALTLARAEIRWNADGLAFRTGVTERLVSEHVQVPAQTGYTKEQVNAIVAERLEAAKTQWEASKPRDEVVTVSDPLPAKNASRAAARSNATRPKRSAPRSLDRDEELADLPRLSDLLNGSF
jgi:anti-sigma factor RsiW